MKLLLSVILSVMPMHVLAQDCLHGAHETPEQRARRVEALGAARHVNTMQANRPDRRGAYLDLAALEQQQAEPAAKRLSTKAYNLAPDAEIISGWKLTLARTEHGYWFMIKDTTDPCGFGYVSNEQGIIYRAEPIR